MAASSGANPWTLLAAGDLRNLKNSAAASTKLEEQTQI